MLVSYAPGCVSEGGLWGDRRVRSPGLTHQWVQSLNRLLGSELREGCVGLVEEVVMGPCHLGLCLVLSCLTLLPGCHRGSSLLKHMLQLL